MHTLRNLLLRLLAIGCIALAAPVVAQTTYTWTGSDPNDNLWTTPGNWNPNGVPGAIDDAVILIAPACELDIATTINALTISSNGRLIGTGDLTVNGPLQWEAGAEISGSGVVTLNGGGLIQSVVSLGGRTLRVASDITLGADGISSVVGLSGGAVVEVNSDASLTLVGQGARFEVASNETATVVNNGEIVVMVEGPAQAAQFDVPLETSGVLRLIPNGRAFIREGGFSTGTTDIGEGAELILSGAEPFTLSGAVTGTGTLSKFGSGLLIENVTDFEPHLDVFGSVEIAQPLTLNRLTLQGNGVVSGTDDLVISDSLIWLGGQNSFPTGFVGSGTVTAQGGTRFDTGQNGGMTLDGRRLLFASDAVIDERVIMTFDNGAVLEVAEGATLTVTPQAFSTQLALETNGTGALVNAGTIAVEGDQFQLEVPLQSTGTFGVAPGVQANIRGGGSSTGTTNVGEGALFVVSQQSLTLRGAVTGTGEMRMGSPSGHLIEGVTVFEAELSVYGSLEIAQPLTLNRLSLINAATLSGDGGLVVNDSLIWDSNSSQFNTRLTGSGTVTANGGVLITRSSGSGSPYLDGRRLLLASDAMIEASVDFVFDNGAVLEVAEGATLTVTPEANSTQLRLETNGTGALVNAGTIAVEGDQFQLEVPFQSTGTLAVASGITVSVREGGSSTGVLGGEGRLLIDQSPPFEIEGIIAPGLAGTAGVFELSLPTSYVMPASSRVEVELGGLAAGTEYDQLDVTSTTVGLGGELAVSLIDGFQPSVGDQFAVLSYVERSGEFESFTGLELGDGMRLEPTYDDENGRLLLTATAEVNQEPTAVADEATTEEGESVLIDVLANDGDPDGDPLSIAAAQDPPNGTAVVEEQQIRYTPDVDFVGIDAFSYTASDGRGGTASATVTVTVTPAPNQAPTPVDDEATTEQDVSVLIDVLANDADADGDPLSIAAVADPPNGTAAVQEQQVLYTPDPAYTGTDTFSYTASDGQGGEADAEVTVFVAPPANQPPTAADDATETNSGVSILIDVLANDSDPDGDGLTLAAVDTPSSGSTAIEGDQVRYTPAPDFVGVDAFGYTVRDEFGAEAAASVSVTVTAIVVDASNSDQPTGGESATIEVTVGGFSPTVADLFYRRAGATAFDTVALTPDGDGFTGTVPSEAVTLRGFDYYVVLSDGVQTATFPPDTPEENPLHVQVNVQSQAAGTTPGGGDHLMLSVPLLTDTDPVALFGDELGEYGPESWRAFRWDPGTSTYRELPDPSVQLAPGTSVWLGAIDEVALEVESGTSVLANAPQTVVLAPGWNQISNPFAFPVAWADVLGTESIDPPELWDGAEYLPNQETLEPWWGYFVENTSGEAVEITVPPAEAVDALRASGGQDELTAGEGVTRRNRYTKSALRSGADTTGYSLRLRAQGPTDRLRDTQNVLGFAASARTGRDRLDRGEPPPPGEHLRLSFVEGEDRLAHSFKPDDSGGNVWEVEVTATSGIMHDAGLPIRVDAEAARVRPDGYELYVLDLDRGAAVSLVGDLDTGATFDVRLDPHHPVRRYRVILGTEAYAETARGDIPLEPLTFALAPNYPNPFDGATTIPYVLEERVHATLEVFDVLGRRVAVLADAEQEAGRYEARWTGRGAGGAPVASGVYIVRLRAGAFTATERVVVVR